MAVRSSSSASFRKSSFESLRSEEHTSELQSHSDLVCRLLLEKKKKLRLRGNCPQVPTPTPNESANIDENHSTARYRQTFTRDRIRSACNCWSDQLRRTRCSPG